MRGLRLFGVTSAMVASACALSANHLLANECDRSPNCSQCDESAGSHCDCSVPSRCDCRDSVSCDCDGCCNRGLLDIVDRFAGRLHQRVNQMTGLLKAEFGFSSLMLDGADGDIGCDSAVTIRQWYPQAQHNDCDKCEGGAEAADQPIDDSMEMPPVPKPQTSRSTDRSTFTGKNLRSQPLQQSVSDPKQDSGNSLNEVPPAEVPQVPRKLPSHTKLPDALLNPFDDESQADSSLKGTHRSESRGLQGRTIQYQRDQPGTRNRRTDRKPTAPQPSKLPSYGQRFDPQASNSTTSADFLAGTNQQLQPSASKIATVSDQLPTLQHIHKRAYSLRLADPKSTEAGEPATKTEESPNPTVDSGDATRDKSQTTAPNLAPVRPAKRLKAGQPTANPTSSSLYDNPLR